MNLSVIGQSLFYIGIAVGITCASKMPLEGSTWPDTITFFSDSLLLSIIGLVAWRMDHKDSKKESSTTEDQTHPQKLLEQLQVEMNTLSTQLSENQPIQELQSNVVAIIERYLIPISDQQQELYLHLGMERAAHVLITLSYVQRILHRFQSALADGHEPEAHSCLLEALDGFLELELELESQKSQKS